MPRPEGLTNKEFYTQMARFADARNIQTVQKYWEAALEVIIRELFYNGTCRCPNLGTFSVDFKEEQIQVQKQKNGEFKTYAVPARLYPTFTPSDDMINDVNMQGITKSYRKRLKNNRLGTRDYLRIARAESIDPKRDQTEEKQKEAEERFRKFLQDKKEKLKGKVIIPEDED